MKTKLLAGITSNRLNFVLRYILEQIQLTNTYTKAATIKLRIVSLADNNSSKKMRWSGALVNLGTGSLNYCSNPTKNFANYIDFNTGF